MRMFDLILHLRIFAYLKGTEMSWLPMNRA